MPIGRKGLSLTHSGKMGQVVEIVAKLLPFPATLSVEIGFCLRCWTRLVTAVNTRNTVTKDKVIMLTWAIF